MTNIGALTTVAVSPPLRGGITAAAALVEDEMRSVEARLGERLESPVGPIPEVGAHLLGAGGKRLRPLLSVLAARATDAPLEHAVAVGRADGVWQRPRRSGGGLLPGARAGDGGADRLAADGPLAGRHGDGDGRGRGGAAGTGRQPRRLGRR